MSAMYRGSLGLMVMCLVASLALAEEDGGGKRQRGQGSHRGDGASRFASIDTDGNGSLSLQEFTVAHEKRVAARKAEMGDKWDEARAAKMPSAEEMFKKMDANGDGALTQSEMDNSRRQRMEARKGARGGESDDDEAPDNAAGNE